MIDLYQLIIASLPVNNKTKTVDFSPPNSTKTLVSNGDMDLWHHIIKKKCFAMLTI